MLSSLTLGYFKAYKNPQTFEFAIPTKSSLGLTILVGPNNSGKSTPILALNQLCADGTDLTLDYFDLHEDHTPILSTKFDSLGAKFQIWAESGASSSYPAKRMIRDDVNATFSTDVVHFIKSVPARRPWNDAFNYQATGDQMQFERNELRRRANQGSELGQQLRELNHSTEKKAQFNELIRSVLPNHLDWDIARINDQDFIVYKTHGGKQHRVSLLGEGFISVFRVAFTLFNSKPGDSILLDEPELSLHPQSQRLLYKTLRELALDRQIIIATHSPYLFEWGDLTQGAKLYRISQNKGNATAMTPNFDTINSINAKASRDIKNRKLYDVVSKEIFFTDQIVFLEGPEDVQLMEHQLSSDKKASLPLFGYGSGGADIVEHWLQLALEIGIIAVGVYDADKSGTAKSVREKFRDHNNISVITLPVDDIRDKHLRDGECVKTGTCRETSDLFKRGFFTKDWVLKPDSRGEYDALIQSIRDALQRT